MEQTSSLQQMVVEQMDIFMGKKMEFRHRPEYHSQKLTLNETET